MTEQLLRVKAPFNLGTFAEAVAIEAVRERSFLRRTVEMVRRERPRLVSALQRLGFQVWPSDANFLLARSPIHARTLLQRLRKREVLLKDMSRGPGLTDCVRITVGTAAAHRQFLGALEEVL